MKPIVSLLILAFIPATTMAQASSDLYAIPRVSVEAQNQRVLVDWDSPAAPDVRGYIVYQYEEGRDGAQSRSLDGNTTAAEFFGTNGRTYVFQVAAIRPDGTEGPRSDPVAATPRLGNDLAYLAVGLIVVWLGIFGYAAFLVRKEHSIDQKLERLEQARFEGRTP